MSSRGSYFLTSQGEHWYHDCSEYNNTIEIEISNIQEINYNFDFLEIIIDNKSEIYQEIKRIWKKDFIIKIPWKNIENYEVNNSEGYVLIVIMLSCELWHKCPYQSKNRPRISWNDLDNYIIELKAVE